MMIKKYIFFLVCLTVGSSLFAQTPRTVIVEHFTNTDCSICGAKNPAFFATLNNYPEVIHIAYHPDLPHPTCKLSMENRPENIARTQFYANIYGATPRAVINGLVIPVKAPTIDATDIDTMLHKYSPVSIKLSMLRVNADSVDVKATLTTTAAYSFGTVYMLVNVTEDTIFYTGTNGEHEHFDVFHKQLYSGMGLQVIPASIIGDSITLRSGFRISSLDSVWNPDRVNLIAMLQDSASKFIYQAAKQTNIDTPAIAPNGIQEEADATLSFYPNPASGEILFSNNESKDIKLFSTSGQMMLEQKNVSHGMSIHGLSSGLYFMHVATADSLHRYTVSVMQ